MANARRIEIQFIGNDRSLGSTADLIGGRTSRLGDKLKSLGKAAAIGLGAVAVGFAAWGVASVKSLARIERINAQTAQAIKSTGGAAGVSAKHVEDLAGKLEGLTAAEAETTQEGANLLLTFTNIKNEAGKGNKIFDQTTAIMVDMSRALGQDTKSSAIQLGKALNDPIKGVTALQRVGVSFTAQQKETIKSLVESGDTMGAQKLILRELTKEFGGSGKAFAKTTEGQIELAKHAFGTLGESIFANVLPPLGKLATAATKGLAWVDTKVPAMKAFAAELSGRFGPAVQRLQPALQRVGQFMTTQVFPAFQAFGSILRTKVMPAVLTLAGYLSSRLGPVFADIARIISTKVWPIYKGLATFWATEFVPAAMKLWASIAKKMRPTFEELVRVFRKDVLPTMSKALTKFEQWRPTIQKVLKVVGKFIGKLIEFHFTVLGKVLPPLIRFTAYIVGKVVPALARGVVGAVRIIQAVFRVSRAFTNAVVSVGKFAAAVGRKVADAARFVGGLPGKAKSALGNLGSTLYSAGVDLMAGFARGIGDKIDDAIDAVRDGLSKIKGLLPGSPIKWGPLKSWNNGGAGKRLMAGVADGIRDGERGVRAAGEVAVSGLAGASAVRGGGGAAFAPTGGGNLYVTINGALDPIAVGRQVEKVLLQFQRSQRRPLAFKATPA